MKDILLQLIRDYHKSDIITKEVLIEDKQGNRSMHIFDTLTAKKWGLMCSDGKTPDVQKAQNIIDQRKSMKARQLFSHARTILKSKDKIDEFEEVYGSPTPEPDKASHQVLFDYAIEALYHLGLIVPAEYSEMSAIVDEGGSLKGTQVHPKEKDDPTEGALEGLQ